MTYEPQNIITELERRNRNLAYDIIKTQREIEHNKAIIEHLRKFEIIKKHGLIKDESESKVDNP